MPRSTRICSVNRCSSKHFGLGYCNKHYKRVRKYGDSSKVKLNHHGYYRLSSKHPLVAVYSAMKDRCYNLNNPHFKNYGGRGIKVCKRWEKDFHNFLKDMGERPTGYTLERINNNKDYKPSNCKWASRKEQGNNTRSNKLLHYMGETKNLTQWCLQLNLPYHTIKARLLNGWSSERAFTTPIRKINNL